MSAPSPFDVLADELGAVAGQIERESSLRIEAAIADMRRVDAERELRLTALERAISDRLASIKDGEPGPKGDRGEPGQAGSPGERGEKGDAGERGEKGDRGDAGEPGAPGLKGDAGDKGDPGERGERGEPGQKGDPGERGESVAGERGPEGPPGKFPTVRAWEDRVYYEGEVATRDGATYQAIRDTGRTPPHDDWNCIAAAGRDGLNGRSFEILGTYKPDGEYRALNVVALNGGAFVAKRDNPGPCPGEGWQLMASQGKQGKPGERGALGQKGDRGPAGPAVVSIEMDAEGLLRLTNGDGSIVDADLYPILSRLG